LLVMLVWSSKGQTDSGFINVDVKLNANLFYYFEKSQNDPSTDPVLLWLQGGPGCSSLFGLFIENGPQIIQPDGSFKSNPWSWTTNASVIWIDSPVGTGFSFVDNDDYATDEKTIANDLYNALVTFFWKLHPELATNNFYIFGESYAGKYIPWLGSTILQNNANATHKINLKGLGIGNGWVNPYYQTGSYGPFLYRHALINDVELEAAALAYETYKGLIDIGSYVPATAVANLLLETLMLEAGVNDPYDIRQPSDPTDPLSNLLETYLNLDSTRKKLNAGTQTWQGCADGPYIALGSDEERSAEDLVPAILTQIPIMLYNGNDDLICNMDGTTTWVEALNWPYQQQFNNAQNQTWSIPGFGTAGSYKSVSTLTHVIVNGAGHMVPYDQPISAHDMVYRFLAGWKP